MPDLEKARRRLARHYLGAARDVKETQTFKALDLDWPQVEGVLLWSADVGVPERVDLFSALVAELSEYWGTRGLGREMVRWCEGAGRACAAVGDRRGEGADLGNLGLAYADLGQVDQAIEHYQQALVISREIGDRRGEGNHLGNLGLAYYSLGQVDQAIEHYRQALAIFEEIRSPYAERVRGWLAKLGE
jgi:tetratricopeptide (TPR) repeat protein